MAAIYEEPIENLRKARANFVSKRRRMASEMADPRSTSSHYAPLFSELQQAIVAIDQAIQDEEVLGPASHEAYALAGAQEDED
ncbi:hypothetical protein SAMN05216548_1291 [Faunimonas pinastri]|uniref:Tubulin-specific chaperone A n=1 Tax=Faunimonas pinastri TaxID=1855383 RepID=A0A1H9QH13_9HYPH|nr:hypothetical protein [Faunimonas pinastri]SER59816.1 hypothetical protein SAMN05216548_1291 [Faunimonas pinastri]